jgi:hypothetical protein
MLTLALTMLSTQGVVLHPSNYGLEGRDDAAPVYGARLLRNHVKAIGVGMLLAQVGEPPPIPPPAGGEMMAPMPARSLQDLRADYQRLEESRPGLAGPIVMLAIGVPCLAVGAALLYTFALYSFSVAFLPVFVISVALVVVGIVLAIIGGVRLGRTIRDRGSIGRQMEDVKRQIEALESAPPPPPPPSSVERNGQVPTPGFALLTF